MKKFLCYDTNDAASGRVNVSANGVLSPNATVPSTNGSSYQQLVTDGDGSVKWEDRLAYDNSKLVVDSGRAAQFIKVANEVPSWASVDSPMKYWLSNGTNDTVIPEDYLDFGNGSFMVGDFVFFIATDNVEFSGTVFPEKGVYFASVPDVFYTTGIASANSDTPEITWDGNVGTIKTIDPKYIPSELNEIILPSSTSGSTKKFKITVNDSGIISAEEIKEPVVPYLIFSSPSVFTISTIHSGINRKGWNGTLEYSTDTKNWTEWDGSEISSVDNGNRHNLYFRGTGNNVITYTTDSYNSYGWNITGSDIRCDGNIESLLDYATVEAGEHPTMASWCYASLFRDCTGLVSAPELPATTLSAYCYVDMFKGCTGIRLSETSDAEYTTPYRIPTAGTGVAESNSLIDMFTGTSGTFAGTPMINTTYYMAV